MHSGKPLLWTVAVSLLAFAACHKPAEQTTTESQPAPVESTPAPVQATPKPVVVVATPPPVNYFAPEGTYYLVAKASLETNDGIVGYPPGTKVMRADDGRFQAPDGQFLTLQPNQMTNDLRIARQVAGADAANQMAIAQSGQQVTAAVSVAETRATGASSSQPSAAPAPAPTRAAAPPISSSSATPTTGLGATHSVVKRITTRP